MIIFKDTELPNVIELRDINMTYNGGKTWVIKDFNILVEDIPKQGQFLSILGQSGCGKTTILRFIAGLQKPTSGEILINGEPRTDDMAISMVFQQYSSFPWMTVWQNIELPLLFHSMSEQERKERVREMINIVGLEGHDNKFAKSPLLSGGQLQRVAIGRSLIANPGIILMDEPFGALDTNTRFQMQQLLANIWDNLQSTIIFVTHEIQEAVFLSDDIFIMRANPGQIVKHFHIDLPLHRDKSIKREPRFHQYVDEIDDAIVALASQKVNA